VSYETSAQSEVQINRSVNISMLADVSLRVTVEVGSVSLTLASLLVLAEGGVLELDRQASDPLDLLVNGTLIAKGEVVETNGRFGIRITEVVQDGEGLGGIGTKA
jgi:flagellar motor switch protein FliN/FliY